MGCWGACWGACLAALLLAVADVVLMRGATTGVLDTAPPFYSINPLQPTAPSLWRCSREWRPPASAPSSAPPARRPPPSSSLVGGAVWVCALIGSCCLAMLAAAHTLGACGASAAPHASASSDHTSCRSFRSLATDEIDAIGKARSSGPTDSGTQEREQGLLQLLTEMDGFYQDDKVRKRGFPGFCCHGCAAAAAAPPCVCCRCHTLHLQCAAHCWTALCTLPAPCIAPCTLHCMPAPSHTPAGR